MAENPESRDWKRDFPQTFGAWVQVQRGARDSAQYIGQSVALPSPWTVAVVAGGIALLLTLILMILDPGPNAPGSAGSITPLASIPSPSSAVGESRISAAFAPLGFPFSWDQRSQTVVTSTGDVFVTNQPQFAWDEWRTTEHLFTAQTLPAPSNGEPYYLRAMLLSSPDVTDPLASGESPTSGAASRDLDVRLDRTEPAADPITGQMQYSLVVQNVSAAALDRVTVRERLASLPQVIDVTPAAFIAPDGALVWEVDNLQPDEERVLVITTAAATAEELHGVAEVDVQAVFTTVTLVSPGASAANVMPLAENTAASDGFVTSPAATPVFLVEDIEPAERPSVQPAAETALLPRETEWPAALPSGEEPVSPELLEVTSEPFQPETAPVEDERWMSRPAPLESVVVRQPRIVVRPHTPRAAQAGEVLTTIYEIVNDGDAAAEGIVLTVSVDPLLRHKYGRTVEHKLERLEPGATHEAVLFTKAVAPGAAQLEAVLSHFGGEQTSYAVSVQVIEAPAAAGVPASAR